MLLSKRSCFSESEILQLGVPPDHSANRSHGARHRGACGGSKADVAPGFCFRQGEHSTGHPRAPQFNAQVTTAQVLESKQMISSLKAITMIDFISVCCRPPNCIQLLHGNLSFFKIMIAVVCVCMMCVCAHAHMCVCTCVCMHVFRGYMYACASRVQQSASCVISQGLYILLFWVRVSHSLGARWQG